jgi:hypothetical protein
MNTSNLPEPNAGFSRMMGLVGVVGLAALVSIALVRQPRPTNLTQVQAAKVTAVNPAQAKLAAEVADLWRVDGPGPQVKLPPPAMDSLGTEMADLWNVGQPKPTTGKVLGPAPISGPIARALADLWRIDVPAKGGRDRVVAGHADTAPEL